MWNSKILKFQNMFQNFKSVLPHVYGYGVHYVLKKVVVYNT